jgi:acetate kinase
MRVLVINAGSSSLKWSVVEMPSERELDGGNEPLQATQSPELTALARRVSGVDAVAHRVVTGGPDLRRTVRIDERVLSTIDATRATYPLHTPKVLAGIAAARATWPSLPHYACFDTTFHATLTDEATRYALPREWTERFGLKRYGFHGLSVAHSVRRAAQMLGRSDTKLVVCHLGSGCSITAVDSGRSVDTTMGFSPLEGVVMGTRSGTVDPGILLHLQRECGVGLKELDEALERRSGLLGLSGVSNDLREVMAARAGNEAARQAYAVFVHSVRRNIGQVLAALGGLDALIFTGGIGEHSAEVRRDVLGPLRWLGLELDGACNESAHDDADLSSASSSRKVLLITAREDLTMAREVVALLQA